MERINSTILPRLVALGILLLFNTITSRRQPTSPRRCATRHLGSAIPSAAVRTGSRTSPRACACCPTAPASSVASGTRPAARSGSTRTAGPSRCSSTPTCAAARPSPQTSNTFSMPTPACGKISPKSPPGEARRDVPICLFGVSRYTINGKPAPFPGGKTQFKNMVVFREAPDNHDLIARGLAADGKLLFVADTLQDRIRVFDVHDDGSRARLRGHAARTAGARLDRATSGRSSTAGRTSSRSRPPARPAR